MKYRKKPVVIEARQYNGKNSDEIAAWSGGKGCDDDNVKWSWFLLPTLEGDMIANSGDYIIKGVKGEFYPCKPDIFEMTYELVEDEP